MYIPVCELVLELVLVKYKLTGPVHKVVIYYIYNEREICIWVKGASCTICGKQAAVTEMAH